jgi:hypothetical protein
VLSSFEQMSENGKSIMKILKNIKKILFLFSNVSFFKYYIGESTFLNDQCLVNTLHQIVGLYYRFGLFLTASALPSF